MFSILNFLVFVYKTFGRPATRMNDILQKPAKEQNINSFLEVITNSEFGKVAMSQSLNSGQYLKGNELEWMERLQY
jgi:hypothetical protein